MSKGLEALEEIKTCKLIDHVKVKEGLFSNKLLGYERRYGKDVFSKQIPIIEKELKQAQEDKEVLNIFRNALTIKHTYVLPKEQKTSDDIFSYSCRYLFEITQYDIDEKVRKSLREWVLKNAFPEELKELNEILALHDKWLGNHQISDFEFFTLLNEIRDKYGLSKEV